MKKIALTILTVFFFSTTILAQEILQQGTWGKIDYRAEGSWSIVKKSDGVYLVLDEDFKTKSGPDLHFLFAKKKIAQLTNANANSYSKVIAELKSPSGANEYKIPDTIDWREYKAVIIHCVRFSHLWAGANL